MRRLLLTLCALPLLATCSDSSPIQQPEDVVFDFGLGDDAPLDMLDVPSDVPVDLPQSGFEVTGGTVTGSGGVTLSGRFRLVSRITPIPHGASSASYTVVGGIVP